MDRDLFLAILSMDAYNRGYDAGINGLGETGMIGNAVISAATAEQKEGWEAAGFYAIAYNWNGETVISYRGTDDNSLRRYRSRKPALPGHAQPQMLAFDSAIALQS